MWKKYTKNYLKNNAVMSISMMITIFISTLFISTVFSIFYNIWVDGIHRIKVEEGEWEGRLIGDFDSSVVNELKKGENIKELGLIRDGNGKEIISIVFKNPRTVYEDLPRIAHLNGIDLSGDTIIEYHDTLLSQYLIFPSQEVSELPLVIPFFIIILLLICSSLVMIIYNAFGISMNSRIHQLGILQSVGATPKQIRNVLLQEALALSAIPVLFGILGGILLNVVFIKFANTIGNTVNAVAARFYYSPIVFLMTMLICFLTVFWATYGAARKYSRIPLLNILKNEIEKPVNKIKKFRIFSMLFGIEGELARKLIYTKRKPFMIARISLTLSFVVFSVFMNFMTLSDISTQQSYFERYKDTWDLMVSFEDKGGGMIPNY